MSICQLPTGVNGNRYRCNACQRVSMATGVSVTLASGCQWHTVLKGMDVVLSPCLVYFNILNLHISRDKYDVWHMALNKEKYSIFITES